MLHSRSTIEVRFAELDPYNHVNHATYLTYREVGRIKAMDRRGIGMQTLDRRGYRIIVVELTARFLSPAAAGDRLEVITDVTTIRRAGSDWRQRIERSGETLFTLEMRAAITDRSGRPVRIPDFFREALSR